MERDAFTQFKRAGQELYHQMARIAVRPQRVLPYDFGSGRLPQFL